MQVAVLHRDLPLRDPFQAARGFADCDGLVLLESGGPCDAASRYSYLCIDPYRVVTLGGAVLRIDGAVRDGDLFAVLAGCLEGVVFDAEQADEPFPFRGGAVGYVGYEAAAGLEAVHSPHPAEADDAPDLHIGLYDLVIGFDRVAGRCRIHASGLPLTDPVARRAHAASRLAWADARLARADAVVMAPLPPLRWTPDWTRAGYVRQVRALQDLIIAGDIFQANFTMRHVASRPAGVDAATVYGRLRQLNPAPFAAWLRLPGHDLCCSSPERFLRVEPDGRVEARPIKGTIARGADAAADARMRMLLADSAKDRAENVMIVDVLRNDLGRVARVGSVQVPILCGLESFASMHHLVSRVTAQLRPDLGPSGALALLRAALPGGSITGAPKVRAMQIIAALEAARRGIYCGCVAWIGFDGAMDSNIVIRSLVLTPGRVIAQAGGGILAESDADAEYAEMQLKAAPMLAVFAAP